MKKILLLVIVGVLIISGFGASAVNTNVEKINTNVVKSQNRDFTHTVLGEYGTGTWCGYCHYAHTALKNIYASGDYPFYYVSFVEDKVPKSHQRITNEFNIRGYPTVWFDGGYRVEVGGYTGTEADHRNSIVACGSRAVYDVDVNLDVIWLGGTNMQIDASVDNNEGSTYDGTIRVYITEIISSMNWKDTTGKLYTFPFLDYAFDADGTGEIISISAGGTWSGSTTWDGAAHGFSSITPDNIMVIGAVYNDEWHQGYSYTPPQNPFDAYYVDDCIGAEPRQGPPPPITHGPTSGEVGEELEYTFTLSDPDVNELYLWIEWDDDTSEEWLGPFNPGEDVIVAHIFNDPELFEITAKLKDEEDMEGAWSNPHGVNIGYVPGAPDITGRTSGKAGESYQYSFKSIDPDMDDIAEYIVDWGDDTGVETLTGPFISGEYVFESHTWTDPGDYVITAKAIDVDGFEGPEGTLSITMPRNKAVTNTLFQRFLQQFPNSFPILRYILG